ncbi:MAG: secretin N-terminal domain-containing protein, partial [Planctomycetia bacterium]|nr:secretin N-terminal domain-containing protein [Planctomycetia bacterium]
LSSRIAKTAITITQPSVPSALMYPISGSRLIVWGAPADHEIVAKILNTLAEAYPETLLRTYPLKHIQVPTIFPFLRTRFAEDAALSGSDDGNTLFVEAPEVVQKQIEAVIKSLDIPSDVVAAPTAIAYDITDIPAASRPGALTSLRAMIPDARFFPTVTPGNIVVYARPATQEQVAAIVKTLLTEQPWLKARLETYPIRNATLAQVISILSPLVPNARFGAGTQANQLIVWAKGSDHDKVKESLGKLNQDATDPILIRIYRFEVGNLTIALNTITTHFPQVVCYPDVRGRTLSVQATASEHEKIAAMIKEFDRVDNEKQTSLQVFNIGSLDYGKFGKALLSFYARDPDFDVQYDATYRSLIVRGTAKQRQTVADLLEKIREGGFADPEATFKSYTLKNSYSYVTLRRVFDEQGKVPMMQIDFSSGKLIVYASPAEHKVVEQILQTLAPEDTILAVFDLVYASPETAQFVITNMLESDGSFIDVQLDPSTNQLYVRATPRKLEEIRQILIRMGETALERLKPFYTPAPEETQGKPGTTAPANTLTKPAGPSTAAAPTTQGPKPADVNASTNAEKPLRTLKTRADAEKILDEVQKIWKRKNELKIIKTQGNSLIQTKENPAGAPAPAPTKPAEAPKPVTPAPAP